MTTPDYDATMTKPDDARYCDRAIVIDEAKTLTVSTVSARQRAADLWDAIRAFRKQEEAQKETVCRPLKTAWDDGEGAVRSFIKECQGYETRLQGLMSAWDREQDTQARRKGGR